MRKFKEMNEPDMYLVVPSMIEAQCIILEFKIVFHWFII